MTGGKVHESTAVSKLVEPLLPAESVIADTGYDSKKIKSRSAIAVTTRESNSVISNADRDWSLYPHRHLVENAVARLKNSRRLATLYNELKRNYQSSVDIACGFLWSPA